MEIKEFTFEHILSVTKLPKIYKRLFSVPGKPVISISSYAY